MSDKPRAAVGHMPFPGHRTCAEVQEQLDGFLEFRRKRANALIVERMHQAAADEGLRFRSVRRH